MTSKVIIIQGEGLGRGDEELGKMLTASFLRLLGESAAKPKTIICLNAGVRLMCEGSQMLNHLKNLAGQGVEILGCTTCLEYFDLLNKIKIGKPTTMAKAIEAMMGTETICL
jgi:selenium metabolism protein YedF